MVRRRARVRRKTRHLEQISNGFVRPAPKPHSFAATTNILLRSSGRSTYRTLLLSLIFELVDVPPSESLQSQQLLPLP
jgi:hypothetical protein